MMVKRLSGALLALILTLSLTIPALAEGNDPWLISKERESSGFSDTANTVWQDAAQTACSAGLLDGYPQGDFRPAQTLSTAQAVTIAARLYNRLTGGDGRIPLIYDDAPWWMGAYQSFRQALLGSSLPVPAYLELDAMDRLAQTPCSREELVRLLSYALKQAQVTLPVINQSVVLPDLTPGVSAESTERLIYGFYAAGILTGVDPEGSFRRNQPVSRGEAAVILSRIIDPSRRVSLTLQTFDLCRDILNAEPEAQALTIGEVSVTMEQAAQELCMSLRQEGCEAKGGIIPLDDLKQSLEIAISELADDAAIDILAARAGFAWSTADLEALYGPIPGSGCMGMTREGWLWEYSHNYLRQQLFQQYTLLYGTTDGDDTAESHLEADLNQVKAALTIVRRPALEALDLSAIQQRLLRLPCNV